MKILIVEDNSSVRNVLRMGLASQSFAIDEAEDGEKGSYMARVNQYDLIILDNHLPKKMAKQVCQEIREANIEIPIILLSGNSDVLTKIELLNVGADDYLTKPFSFGELNARIQALLRRPQKIEDVVLKVDKIKLNTSTHEITCNNKRVYLTRKEFSLLEILMKNEDKVLSRAFIMEHVWDINSNPFSNTIESHILNLRKKIGDKNKKIIHNVPGRGYKISTKKNFK